MRIHFIAIGGSIMHNLAISLAEQGHQVSGSDDLIVEPSRTNLIEANLLPDKLGWYPELITEDLDAVVLGMHAEEDNEELIRAKELGIKIYSFPEFIYEQSLEKTRIVVAGTYGKTTIMSMIMHILKSLNVEFDYVVSAQLKGFDTLLKINPHSKFILIEGDETSASAIDKRTKFEVYKPHIALISGVEWKGEKNSVNQEEYYQRFENLILSIEPKGTLIYNKDSKSLTEIIDHTKDHKINRHGYNLPHYKINKGVTYLENGEENIPLKVFGKNNLSNIAGAFTVCEWLGVKRDQFFDAIQNFESSIRYLEFVSSNSSSVVYQDFAHTPSKLKFSIHAIKEQFPDRKLLTVLELHHYELQQSQVLESYKDSLAVSDYVAIYLSLPDTLEHTSFIELFEDRIHSLFNLPGLYVTRNKNILKKYLEEFDSSKVNLLLMSSAEHSEFNMVEYADSFLISD